MKKIVVIGSLNMDLVARVIEMPKVGETVFGNNFKQIPGGKGANQAVAIARLGGEVSMIGRVGGDNFGDTLIQGLKADGIDVDAIQKVEGIATGTALIMVNERGNNSIVVIPGANFNFNKEDLMTGIEAEKLSSADIVLMQLEIPLEAVSYALKRSKELGKFTILNPAPAVALSNDILKSVDLLLPNETELEGLSGIPTDTKENILKGTRVLLDKGVRALLVTLGDKGAVYVSKEVVEWFSAYPVAAVDTTAAGDSFAAAVAVALSEEKSLKETIDFAMKVGALTVTKEGAQSSLPYRQEVEQFEEGRK